MTETKKETLRVLIADDHKIFRVGMVAILNTIPVIQSVQQAQNGDEVMNWLQREPFDVIFMDIKMPVMNGIEVTKRVKQLYPDTKVIALSFYEDHESVAEMFANGASAYLLKNTDREEIEEALETVLKGDHYYSRELSDSLFRQLIIKSEGPLKEDGTYPLTDREKEVLVLLCKEFSNREIAEQLSLSARTVEGHRNRLMQKTNAKNTVGLVTYAIRNKIWDGH